MNLVKAKLIKTDATVIEEKHKKKQVISFFENNLLGKIYTIDLDSLAVQYGQNTTLNIFYFVPCVLVYETNIPCGYIIYECLEVVKQIGSNN